jgi:hypothetical protein
MRLAWRGEAPTIERVSRCCYAWPMADDNAKPEPVRFPVVIEVNGVKVEVILTLQPGTTIAASPYVTVTTPDDDVPDPDDPGEPDPDA